MDRGKSIGIDFRHVVRDYKGLDPFFSAVQVARAGGRDLRGKAAVAPLRKVGDVHARQPVAVVERIIPDARHAVGYRHARKPAAAVERTIPDALHGLAAEGGGNGDCTCC